MALAWWILNFKPDLLQKAQLSILVAGAGINESCDEGRWWSFMPWLLGREQLLCHTTVVGNELTGNVPLRSITPSWRLTQDQKAPTIVTNICSVVEQFPPALIVNGLLSDVTGRLSKQPDLCVLFSPGFESHYQSWLSAQELPEILMAGIPVAAFSYTELDFQIDMLTLESCGVRVTNQKSYRNPWSRDDEMATALGAFAKQGWCLQTDSDLRTLKFDEEGLARRAALLMFAKPDFEEGGDNLIRNMGVRLEVGMQNGDALKGPSKRDAIYLLMRSVFVLESDGQLGYVSDDNELEFFDPPVFLSTELLTSWPGKRPGMENMVMQRALWTIALFRDHVQVKLPDDVFFKANEEDLEGVDELLQLMMDAINQTQKPRGSKQVVSRAASKAFFAALEDDLPSAIDMVKVNPALLKARNHEGKTCLMLLNKMGQHELLIKWASDGADLNTRDDEGFGLVHDIISDDNASLLKTLHALGLDLNLPTSFGFTPSNKAIHIGSYECLEYLVQEKADITTPAASAASVANLYSKIDLPPRLAALIRSRL